MIYRSLHKYKQFQYYVINFIKKCVYKKKTEALNIFLLTSKIVLYIYGCQFLSQKKLLNYPELSRVILIFS